jgi:hypothetical protein
MLRIWVVRISEYYLVILFIIGVWEFVSRNGWRIGCAPPAIQEKCDGNTKVGRPPPPPNLFTLQTLSCDRSSTQPNKSWLILRATSMPSQ